MKIYEIKILKSVSGREYIKFFFKTLRKKKEIEIEKFKKDMQIISTRKITDEEMIKYNDEKLFVKKLKLSKIFESDIGSNKTTLYKNNEIWLCKIELKNDKKISFKDNNILLKKDFFMNNKYTKYVILKAGHYGNILS